jgi:hypothetical protein
LTRHRFKLSRTNELKIRGIADLRLGPTGSLQYDGGSDDSANRDRRFPIVFLKNSLLESDLGGRKITALFNVQRRSLRRIEPIEPRLAHTCIRPHVRKHQPISNTHVAVKARLGRNSIRGVARLAPYRVHALSGVVLVVEPPLPDHRNGLVPLLAPRRRL